MTTYFLSAEKCRSRSTTARSNSLNPLMSLSRRLSHILTNTALVSPSGHAYEEHLTVAASSSSPVSTAGQTVAMNNNDLDIASGENQQHVSRSRRGSTGNSVEYQNGDRKSSRQLSLSSYDDATIVDFKVTQKTSVCCVL
jgi:hypothetical protein